MISDRQFAQLPAQNELNSPFWRRPVAILLLILFLAAFLRLVNLGQSPPGLNQDEAASAWNAYCLLKTGKDQTGVSWPIFYLRTLGSNGSTPLYIYATIPFLAIGGLSIWTVRFVSAFFGILCIPLIYYIASRLFDRCVGLVAALLLALNPWHLQLSRWGHEGCIAPLLGLVPLAVMLWAKMPIRNENPDLSHLLRAALAGALSGISCYSYPAIRLFIPPFLALIILVTLPAWWHSLKTRKGALAIAAFIIAFAATFGPLAFKHLTDPENIAKRAQGIWIWNQSDPTAEKVKLVLTRYVKHFGPDFLFIEGDHYVIQSPPNAGQYHWYMLPLMLLGLIPMFKNLKSSYPARILFVFILVYPAGDILNTHTGSDLQISLHALRSAPGLCSMVLLAALGAVTAAGWLWKKNPPLAWAAIAALTIAIIGFNLRYFYHFYGEYNRRPNIYQSFHVDLVEACNWLRPRLDQYDAVFCTSNGMNTPYIITLVVLGYDPNRWLHEGCDVITRPEFDDIYLRYGKMHFMYGGSAIPAITSLRPEDRAIFIVRPNELGFKNPIHQICHPDGTPTLWLCQQ